MTNITVTSENPLSKDAALLIGKLTQELGERYEGTDASTDGGGFKLTHVTVPRSVFVVARVDGRPVGCGALRPKSDDVAEVKRMYTEPEMRGRGIARRILNLLERFAREYGYEALALRTGVRQPEAIHVYEAMGYRQIDCDPENPLLLCFEKKLVP